MEAVDFYMRMVDCIHRVKEKNARLMQPFCSEYGITPQGLRVLAVVHAKGAQTVSALAQCTSAAGANTSALCKKLETEGYVQRKRDHADERQVLVSLTEKGEELAEKFKTTRNNTVEQISKNITQQERATIIKGLECLLDVIATKLSI